MEIFSQLAQKFSTLVISDKIHQRLSHISPRLNELGYDNWGMHLDSVKLALNIISYFYEHYFRTELYGIEKVPNGRVLLIPNHSGQLPLDGALLFYAMAMYGNPPRIVRAMVERFVPRLPFISTFFIRCGQVTGTPLNCQRLLENEEAVMVFPEGVRGSGKLYWQRYRVQKFGTGFMRLALETDTPIVPVAIIGAEETYPAIYNSKFMAKLLKTPYFPITPFWPFLGPLGVLPLPTKIRIYFGDPMKFTGDFDGPESEIQKKVDIVSQKVQSLIQEGLKKRKTIFLG